MPKSCKLIAQICQIAMTNENLNNIKYEISHCKFIPKGTQKNKNI